MTPHRRPIAFNGKFYCGELNGVHRVADRLIREVDRQVAALPARDRPELVLMLPEQRRWTPALGATRLEPQRRGHTQFWEQGVLPGKAAGQVLVNLCNLAPLRHRNQLLLLHDAQFMFPDCSYTPRQRWGHRLLASPMARRSARVLTVSQYSRAMLDLTGIVPRERTGVLYNGVDHILEVPAAPDALTTLGLKPHGFVLLFGSTKRYKNVELLFEAFRDPRLDGITLLVVGVDRAAHERAGMVPPSNALFAGRIKDDALRSLYEHALCVALPSRTEGFGLPPVEAMQLGCPAIVAPAGAIPEICRDAACYADVDRPEEWVDSILKLAGDPVFRASKVAVGRTRAADFTWARAGATLLEELLRLAAA